MENAVDDVPDYMVAVKSEFLVNFQPKNKNSATRKESASSDICHSATAVEQNAHSLKVTDASVIILEPANQVDVVHSTVGGNSPGYKSNGYKLDDRDKQRTNNWDKKKDYTLGNWSY